MARSSSPSHRRAVRPGLIRFVSTVRGAALTSVLSVVTVVSIALGAPVLAAACTGGSDPDPTSSWNRTYVQLDTPTSVAALSAFDASVALHSQRELPEGVVVVRVDGRRVAASTVSGGSTRQQVTVSLPALATGTHQVSASYYADGHLAGRSSTATVLCGDDPSTSPSDTPSDAPSVTASSSPTSPTAGATPTVTASPSATPTASETATPTATPTASDSPTVIATPTSSPTTIPTTTPTASPTGGLRLGCAVLPSACGYPDATNTGVTPGTTLRTINGSVTLDQPGTVFENAIVTGSIDITADDVTVRNVRILENGEGWGIGLIHTHNATISDCEIAPTSSRLLVGIKDIYGDATGTTVRGCDIARTTTGVQTNEGLIADNYIHDMAFQDGDHVNGTTSNGSTEPLTIEHNTIYNQQGQTDAISLFQDFGLEANRTITRNLLAGGGYTIYGGDGEYGSTHDIVITDNRIARVFFPLGGYYGPVAAFDSSAPGNVWSGNVWDDTGAPVSG